MFPWRLGSPLVRACSFLQSLRHLLWNVLCFGCCKAVVARPHCIASYTVPVRQYRSLQSHFLQRIPYGKPPCDLLTLPGVTRCVRDLHPLENLTPVVSASIIFVYLNFLSRLRRVCAACSCRAHTACSFNCRDSAGFNVSAFNNLRCNLTGKYFEIGN